MSSSSIPMNTQRQNKGMISIALTLFMRPNLIFFSKSRRSASNRPVVELFTRQLFNNDYQNHVF
jgi:hypothetical protein